MRSGAVRCGQVRSGTGWYTSAAFLSALASNNAAFLGGKKERFVNSRSTLALSLACNSSLCICSLVFTRGTKCRLSLSLAASTPAFLWAGETRMV